MSWRETRSQWAKSLPSFLSISNIPMQSLSPASTAACQAYVSACSVSGAPIENVERLHCGSLMHGAMVRQIVDSSLLALKPGLGGQRCICECADREVFVPVQSPGLEGQPSIGILHGKAKHPGALVQGRHGGRGNLGLQKVDPEGDVGPRSSSDPCQTSDYGCQSCPLLRGNGFGGPSPNANLYGSDDPRVVSHVHRDGEVNRLHVFPAAKPERALLNLADAERIQDMLDDAVALRRGGEQQIIHVRAQLCHEVTCAVYGKVHCRKNSRGTETSFHGDVDQSQVKVPPCVHRPIDGNSADEDISRVDSGVRKACS